VTKTKARRPKMGEAAVRRSLRLWQRRYHHAKRRATRRHAYRMVRHRKAELRWYAAHKRRARSNSVSGLSAAHVREARRITVKAAALGLHRAASLHYTQGGMRWQGVARRMRAYQGECPNYADCSSFVTWCLGNAFWHFKHRDTINRTGWSGGYTGTLLSNGRRVTGPLQLGDVAIYGHGFPGHHCAIYVGGGMVISFGSERGPFKLPLHYRSDLMQVRRFI
jgi:hypothetical protein